MFYRQRDSPDQESPVGIDNTDPSFVNWIGDVIKNRRVRIEPLNRDFFKFETFTSLMGQLLQSFIRRQDEARLTKFSPTNWINWATVMLSPSASKAAKVSFRGPLVGCSLSAMPTRHRKSEGQRHTLSEKV
jgi:hypothetical protein